MGMNLTRYHAVFQHSILTTKVWSGVVNSDGISAAGRYFFRLKSDPWFDHDSRCEKHDSLKLVYAVWFIDEQILRAMVFDVENLRYGMRYSGNFRQIKSPAVSEFGSWDGCYPEL